MMVEEAKKHELEQLQLLKKQLVAIGVPERSVVSAYRFGRDIEFDLVVLNEGCKFPSMCFEIKSRPITEAPKSICRALDAGVRCYVVMPGKDTGSTVIALLKSANPILPFGEWVDLADGEKVRQLIPDYYVASSLVENLVVEKEHSERTKVVDGLKVFACKVYLPVMLLLALIHVFVKLTWQHLALYGIITIVILSVFGVRLVFQGKGFTLLLDGGSGRA